MKRGGTKANRILSLAMRAKEDDSSFAELCEMMRYMFVHAWRRMPYHEYIREEEVYHFGCLGIFEAVGRFDPDKSENFINYSYQWIKNVMRSEIHIRSMVINVPGTTRGKHSRVMRKIAEMERKLSRRPTVEEISRETGYSVKVVRNMMRAPGIKSITSMDEKIGDSDTTVGDFVDGIIMSLDDHDGTDKKEAMRRIISIMREHIKERNMDMVEKYFGISGTHEDGGRWTLEKIAEVHGISRQAVDTSIDRTLEKAKYIILKELDGERDALDIF